MNHYTRKRYLVPNWKEMLVVLKGIFLMAEKSQ